MLPETAAKAPVVTEPAAAKAVSRAVMFESHHAGHAHMRYSAQLAAAMGRACPDRQLTLLLSSAGEDASIPGVEIERAIEAPRTLASFRWRALGILQRCARWGRTDRQVVSWVRRHPGVEVLHYQDWYGLPTLFCFGALRRLGIRSVLTVHNVRPHDFRWWEPAFAKDFIDRKVFRGFDALVVHSDLLKDELVQFLGRKTPPVYVVPHGVMETFLPAPPPPLDERMAARKLLFIGSPRPNKGLPLLLEALRFLPEFSLTIAGLHGGYGRYMEHIHELIAAARKHGCRIDVRSGFVADEELDSLLRTHSAVMLPYRPDFRAQSGVLSQAIAYQAPIVATDVGALGETVKRFRLGTVVPPESPSALAAGVRKLYAMESRELSKNLAEAAKTLSWNAVAPILSDVYDAVCAA